MKKQILFLTLLPSLSSIYAQNIYFKKFGTSSDVVKRFLETRKNLKFLVDSEELIIASTGNMIMTYHFHQGILYKTMLQKTYDSKKESQGSQKNLTAYYELLQAEMIEMEDTKAKSHFVAIKNREIHEVYRVSGKTDNRLQMISTSLDLNPEKIDEYYTIENSSMISMVNW